MTETVLFICNSLLLGVGLAMDAFSVSLANGLQEPRMRTRKRLAIAGVFSFFQALMPLIGWFCVHQFASRFHAFEAYIPWIALLLLGFIGGKMLFEGIRKNKQSDEPTPLTGGILLMQGIATSIDALSVGFTIAEYEVTSALVCALLIASVTFVICLCGVWIGRKCGTRLADKASVLGGAILIGIGLEIFISSFF